MIVSCSVVCNSHIVNLEGMPNFALKLPAFTMPARELHNSCRHKHALLHNSFHHKRALLTSTLALVRTSRKGLIMPNIMLKPGGAFMMHVLPSISG